MRRDVYFNAVAAQRYGVDGAIMLHHLVYWVVYNQANGLNLHEGRVWTYNSARAFSVFFPYWTAEQIRRVLRNLEKDAAIEVSQFNRMGMDRTKWYTVTAPVGAIYDLALPQFGESPTPFGQTPKSILANDQMHFGERPNQYQVRNTIEEPVKNQVQLPWDDDGFAALWSEWKKDRRERNIRAYTERGEQAALHKLQLESGGDVRVAIAMIQNSIANGYQGIFPVDKPAKHKGGLPGAGFDVDTLRDWATSGG